MNLRKICGMSAEEMQRKLYLDRDVTHGRYDGKSSVRKDSVACRGICLQGSADLPTGNVVSLALWRAGKAPAR